MAQLSSEIQELINQVKLLKQKEPTNKTFIDQYDKLEEQMEEAQDREWNENHKGYLDAQAALKAAKAEAEKKLKDLSDTATVIEKIASAIDKVGKALAALGKIA
jgi:chromosome segregation ATPase